MKTRLHPGCGHILKDCGLLPDPAQARAGKLMDDNFQPVA